MDLRLDVPDGWAARERIDGFVLQHGGVEYQVRPIDGDGRRLDEAYETARRQDETLGAAHRLYGAPDTIWGPLTGASAGYFVVVLTGAAFLGKVYPHGQDPAPLIERTVELIEQGAQPKLERYAGLASARTVAPVFDPRQVLPYSAGRAPDSPLESALRRRWISRASKLLDGRADEKVRGLGALAALRATDRAPRAASLLSDASPYVRAAAAGALGALGAKPYAERLAPLLLDASMDARGAAVAALKGIGYQPPTKQIFKMAADAVALIVSDCGQSGRSLGTGFFIDGGRSVITNRHVVQAGEDCPNPVVSVGLRDGRGPAVARVVEDTTHDLARIDLQEARLGTWLWLAPEPPEIGDDLIIIGNPQGLGWSLSEGHVSALRQGLDETDTVWIQTDAASNHGNSGGPMLNRYGQVIGVATSGLRGNDAQGLNFGIAASAIEAFLRSRPLRAR